MYRTAGMIDRNLADVDLRDPAAVLKRIEEYDVECSMLKVWCSEMLDYVVDETVQVFGGAGFVEDYPAERYWRDARVNRIFEGTNEINRLLVPGRLRAPGHERRASRARAGARAAGARRAAAGGADAETGFLAAEAAMARGAKKAALLCLGRAVETLGQRAHRGAGGARPFRGRGHGDLRAGERGAPRAQEGGGRGAGGAAWHEAATRCFAQDAMDRVETRPAAPRRAAGGGRAGGAASRPVAVRCPRAGEHRRLAAAGGGRGHRRRRLSLPRMTATLLVVDDNEQNRDMLSRRLAKRGYTVSVAEGGARALEMLREAPVDLVLLDIEMPGMSGLEVLKALRQTTTRADLPVIMATARDQGEDIVEALNLGANDYVTKPLDFPVVIARVESQLSLKHAMEEIRRLAGELEIRNRSSAAPSGATSARRWCEPAGDAGGARPRRREARGDAAMSPTCAASRPWPTATPRSRWCPC